MSDSLSYESLVQQALAIHAQVAERQSLGQLVYDRDMAILRHQVQFMQHIEQRGIAGELVRLMGVIEAQRGAFSTAHEYFRQALECYEVTGDKTSLAATLSNIGELHRLTGEFSQALNYYERARQIALKHENWTNASLVLNNIGLLHLEQQAFTRAQEYFEEALEYSLRVNTPPVSQAETYSGLARAYLALGRSADAWKAANRALEVSEIANNTHDLADANRTLGIIAAQTPDLGVNPEHYFLQSSLLYNASDSQAEFGRTIVVHAQWLTSVMRTDEARTLLIKAKRIFSDLQLADDQATAQRLLDQSMADTAAT